MATTIEITDLQAPELDIYARLSERQLRGYFAPAQGLFIAESDKVIDRALNAGYRPVSMLVEKGLEGHAVIAQLISRCGAAAEGRLKVYTAPLPVLEGMIGYKLTRSVLCAMRRRELPALQSLAAAKAGGITRVAVLENVMNPTNLGAIFRSAAAMKVDAVLLTPSCTDPLYRRAARVSMGTVFQIRWTIAPMEEIFSCLEERGFATAALALRGDTIRIDDPVLCGKEKLALFLGTEGEGLTDETIGRCDYTVKIPMAAGIDSLNVAAASAVAFWATGNGM